VSLLSGGRTPAQFASLLLIAAVLAASGCGGDDAGSAEQSQQGPQLSARINLADCRDWNDGSVDERLGTIRGIREFLGGPVPGTGGTGAVLEDEQAYDLFEGWCENEFARGFKLYKLYARAAAFSDQ
jgi:hypothetical protein